MDAGTGSDMGAPAGTIRSIEARVFPRRVALRYRRRKETSMRALLASVLLSLLAAPVTAAPVAGDTTALRLGGRIDGRGGAVEDAVVVLQGDRIDRIDARYEPIPPGAK